MDGALVFFSIAACACALFLRLLPHRMATGTLAVDHWYWKAYLETLHRDRQFPPILPQYLFDEHQWYPPLFPRLMAALPEALFTRYNFEVSIGIDLMRMVLLLGGTAWLTGGEPYAVLMAGLVYATTPILISYNTQLNPRGLGALFLDGLALLFVWLVLFDGPIWAWGVVLGLAGLILLTHKMTTQLFWFLCLVGGIAFHEWRFFALIPGSIAAAMLLSNGFYWKILRAHWDVVTFWNRNWRWLQAHPILESPIYGEPGYETSTKFHRKGLAGMIRHLSYLSGFSPAAWILTVLWVIGLASFNYTPVSVWIVGWMQVTLLFSLLTVFIHPLKCLGSGYYYLYNAAFPTALITGMLLTGKELPEFAWVGVAAALGGNLLSLLFYYGTLRTRSPKSDEQFEHVIEYLKTMPKGIIMCLPPQWYDEIAYKTGQPVLWGAHGYGFKLLEPVFPRLLLPIQDAVRRYRIRYLVSSEGYLPDRFLAELQSDSVVKFGNYRVFLTKS